MTERDSEQANRRQALRDDVRFRLLRALENEDSLSQRGLAREIGVSLGATNALLNGLIAEGLVQVGNGATAPGGFRLAYALTEAGRADRARLTGGYLARRRAERDALQREIEALRGEPAPGADPAG